MRNVVSAALIAAGITLAGVFVYCGIHQLATKDRIVTVKGLSTRDVQADFVVWPLRLDINANELSTLSSELSRLQSKVTDYFVSKGFKAEEISLGNIDLDNNWQGYYEHRPEYHYTLRTSIIIATNDVERVVANQGAISDLLAQGIVLSSNSWSTDYQFNGLNDLKPEMIEEATKNAREVAEKFAADSRSKLGGIRNANQGQFTISSDDQQPWKKHVRVVTTISYNLK